MSECTVCNKSTKTTGWFLKGYYGVSGYFCSKCYAKVRHDAYGNPSDPKEYLVTLLKLGINNASN